MIRFALSLVILTAFAVLGIEITGKVVRVYDGDTIRIETIKGEEYKVRFAGIDAPESSQDFGSKATACLSRLIGGEYVLVDVSSVDMYGRLIGTVFVRRGRDTVNVNSVMLAQGLAWFYPDYCNDAGMEALEKQARGARKGLWRRANPVRPSEYRKAAKQSLKDKEQKKSRSSKSEHVTDSENTESEERSGSDATDGADEGHKVYTQPGIPPTAAIRVLLR